MSNRSLCAALLPAAVLFSATSPSAGAGTCDPILFGAAHAGGPAAASTLYRIDTSTGTATAVGPIGFHAVGAMDFDPATGVLYGTGNRPADGVTVLLRIEPNTGAGKEIGPLGNMRRGPFDLSFRGSDAALFAVAFSVVNPCSSLYSVDPVTGTATEIGDTATCAAGDALGFSPAGTLFQANSTAGGTLFTVDPLFGLSTFHSALIYAGFPPLADPRPNAMDFDPSTGKAFVSVNDGTGGSGPNYLGVLDPGNGRITFAGSTVNGLDALAYGPLLMSPYIGPAVNQVDFEWTFPLAFRFVRGAFVSQSDIGAYRFDLEGTGSGTILSDPLFPPVGSGLWYLLRPDCQEGSWSSGGSGECSPPGVCPGGGRDANLP